MECSICKSEFIVQPHRIKNQKNVYCSKICANKASIRMVEKQCPICKKLFKIKRSRLNEGRGKYCSKKCAGKSRRGKKLTGIHKEKILIHLSKLPKPTNCPKCGRWLSENHKCISKEERKNFCLKNLQNTTTRKKAYVSRMKKIKTGEINFDYLKHPRSKKTKEKISITKKTLYALGLHNLNPKIKKGFCLNTGRTHFKKGQLKGKKHHNWKGGVSTKKKLLWGRWEYQEWRKKVFERDNYTCQNTHCQFCNNIKGVNLNAHHIKYINQFPKLIYDVSNGITYCREYHIEYHRRHGFNGNKK